jgi:AAA15 family ATPase/GTPase
LFSAIKDQYYPTYWNEKHVKNSCKLGKNMIITGVNASGKTTILKALDFLIDLVLEPKEKKTEILDFNPFLFDPHTPDANSIFSIEFIFNINSI